MPHHAFATALAALPLIAAWGATNAVSVLPTVTVVATPITQEESVAKDGADSTTVSRDQLAQLNAQDLQTALRQVPGVTVSRYAPVGSYGGAQGGSVYVRGMGTARPGGEVRMYTDGVPRDAFTPFGGEFYVSLENLTNSHHAYYPGYPMDGIMWYLGCKLKF